MTPDGLTCHHHAADIMYDTLSVRETLLFYTKAREAAMLRCHAGLALMC
jgi:hypothetical protein